MIALSEFERRLQSLRDDRSRLVQSLRQAAKSIREQGQPPSLETIDVFQFYRKRYIDLHQSCSSPEHADELPTFDQFEVQRQRLVQIETLSESIQRASQLGHIDPARNSIFEPVQESVKVLVEQLHQNPDGEDVQRFESGAHPLAILLRMSEGLESLEDDEWDSFQQQIGEEWGRAVAVAVARGRTTFK